jgi:hypothetical protein
VLDHLILAHAPATGWVLLANTAVLALFAFWGGRHATALTVADVGRGLLGGLWLLTTGLVLAQAVRLLAGPISTRVASADTYYVLLRRLPWMEGGVALTILAVGLAALAGRDVVGRRVLAGVVIAAALLATALNGFRSGADRRRRRRRRPEPVVAGRAALGLGRMARPDPADRPARRRAVQAVAPEAAFLLIWPALAPRRRRRCRP